VGDLNNLSDKSCYRRFNPRPRVGGDGTLTKFYFNKRLSNVYREPVAFTYQDIKASELSMCYLLVNEQIMNIANLPVKTWMLGVRG
jgi:hypothetical protein